MQNVICIPGNHDIDIKKYLNERFVYTDEYNHLLQIMSENDNYKILISGLAGSGKTTLLYMLKHNKSHSFNEIVNLSRVYKNTTQMDRMLSSLSKESVLLIDGIEYISNSMLHEMLGMINSIGFRKLVCTSRSSSAHSLTPYCSSYSEYFTHSIVLHPLNKQQVHELLKKQLLMLTAHDLGHMLMYDTIEKTIDENGLTPRELINKIYSIMGNSELKTLSDITESFSYKYGFGVGFGSEIILSPKELIVPSKEIITNVIVLENSLLKKAKENPNIIHSYSPREFEEMICELLDKKGHKVKLTKQTRDGGKDIIVVQKSILGNHCIYVECKKYDPNRPVSVGLIKELYGTVVDDKVTAGLMITTSYFSPDAKAFTKRNEHRMSIMEYCDLVQALSETEI